MYILCNGDDLPQLVVQAQQGKPEAFAEICRRFEGLVVKQAAQAHLRSIREDAKAEGLLAVVEGVKTYNPASGVPFAGYVESRVRYRVWNLFKRERRRWQRETLWEESRPEDDAGIRIDAEVENGLMAASVRRAIAELPDKQRLVVTATLLGEAGLADVARELQVSVQAAHGLRKRAIARLRTQIGD
ncbi:MAG: sigma70-ECF: polymerase sigma factor, sigma-70 family [Firmicutes bacterium]|nr:sigma70-ECF: polymerase sigma factor, sigma-70 family [Bacillota bacterium]